LLLNPNGALSAFAQSFFNDKSLPPPFLLELVSGFTYFFVLVYWKDKKDKTENFDLGIAGW